MALPQVDEPVEPVDVPSDVPSFQRLYDEVFAPEGCTAGYCHGASAGGLDGLDADTLYAALVDVEAQAAACGLTRRVVPGDPESSILWYRVRPSSLDDGAPCAAKMPAGMGDTGLSEEAALLVYDWIAGGALR